MAPAFEHLADQDSHDIPLHELLEMDQPAPVVAFEDVFGDGYLCRVNCVFRNIRDAVVQRGYRFTSASDSDLWRDYEVLPLCTLPRIQESRTIPYFANRPALLRLAAQVGSTPVPLRFLRQNLRHNHVLHESAHCVAHEIVRSRSDGLSAACRSAREASVVGALLGEAFANVVETISSAELWSEAHAFFFGLNSFMRCTPARGRLLQRAADQLGSQCRFATLLFCYFEANCGATPAASGNGLRIFELAGIRLDTDPPADVLAGLLTIGFDLYDGFSENVNPVFFRLMNCESEYRALRADSWLARPKSGDFARTLADAFRRAVEEGRIDADARAAV